MNWALTGRFNFSFLFFLSVDKNVDSPRPHLCPCGYIFIQLLSHFSAKKKGLVITVTNISPPVHVKWLFILLCGPVMNCPCALHKVITTLLLSHDTGRLQQTPECRKKRLKKTDGVIVSVMGLVHLRVVRLEVFSTCPAANPSRTRPRPWVLPPSGCPGCGWLKTKSAEKPHVRHTHTHTCTDEVRPGAKSQHTPFKRSPAAPLQRHKIIKSAQSKSESTRAAR